jgi:hypothetical protein
MKVPKRSSLDADLMQEPPLATAAQLKQWSASSAQACRCGLGACAGWESITESRWPAGQMQAVATLRRADEYEPTFEEHHPQGTRYDSPDAPVAARFFPYNRCDVFQCGQCERYLMRYTEYGGYYVDHRARCLNGAPVAEL